MPLPYICITKAPQLLQASGISCTTVRNAVPLLCVWAPWVGLGCLRGLATFCLELLPPLFLHYLWCLLSTPFRRPCLTTWTHPPSASQGGGNTFAPQLQLLPLLLNVGKREHGRRISAQHRKQHKVNLWMHHYHVHAIHSIAEFDHQCSHTFLSLASVRLRIRETETGYYLLRATWLCAVLISTINQTPIAGAHAPYKCKGNF